MRLDEVVELDVVSGEIVQITNVRTIVDAPPKRSGGRPNQFGEKLEQIILTRSQSGQSLSGHNAEARAIRDLFYDQFPNERPPSVPTIKRYLTKTQGGS